jgi:hypothetical protein
MAAQAPAWEDRLSELADYRNPRALQCSSGATAKTPSWLVGPKQRSNTSYPRRKGIAHQPESGIGSLGFEWNSFTTAWEDRLSELADYRKSTGTVMFPIDTVKTPRWVVHQRVNTSCSKKERSPMTDFRIQGIESLWF